ncbi:UBX domain-containing protein 6-like [Oscarella lobularis]|uniref:UBX domain-containing protein 6-like n=1 Tax=Oscarella lobularis TaxID=121494 RepID=UPI003313F387
MKNWFKKKLADSKFKGKGHVLTEERKVPSAGPQRPAQRIVPTAEAAAAGQAALARFEDKQTASAKKQDQRKAMRYEMEIEKRRAEQSREPETENAVKESSPAAAAVALETPPGIPVSGVEFVCPVTDAVVAEEEIEVHLEAALLSYLDIDDEEEENSSIKVAALMIYSLNKSKEVVQSCVDLISRYVGNVTDNPAEAKYRKIRVKNRAFQERAAHMKGAIEFLNRIGFKRETLANDNDEQEDYLVLAGDEPDVELLIKARDILRETKPLVPTLSRSLRLFSAPKQNSNRFDLPPSFFAMSSEELKAEQRRRAEKIEQSRILKTKAMREREAAATPSRKYRYCVIRVRLPDGMLLQGTFRPRETVDDVRQFACGALADEVQAAAFGFMDPAGRRIRNEGVSLAEAGLVPSAVLSVAFDPETSRSLQSPYCRLDLLDKLETLG